jgi:hypothetical protein
MDYEKPQCAVVDCENDGRRQICPYDHRVHGHGRIHYPTDQGDRKTWPSVLNFRPLSDGWFLMCDDHNCVVSMEVTAQRRQPPFGHPLGKGATE